MKPRIRCPFIALPSALVICAGSHTALAATFDDTGRLLPDDGAILFEGFETESRGLSLELGPALEGARFARIDASSERTFTLGPGQGNGSADANGLSDTTRRVIAKVFVRGAIPAVSLTTPTADGGHDFAPLYPTGLVTSDEWVELASAPLSLDHAEVALTFRNAAAQPIDLDAVELIDAGPRTAAISCSPPIDPVCGGGACVAGRCVPAGQRVPPLPNEALRTELAAYLASVLETHFGGVKTREERLPFARAALALAPATTSAEAYWRALASSFQALHDSHSAGFIGTADNPRLAVCFLAGEADLGDTPAGSPASPAILVSHGVAGQMGPFAVGDRLVAVNGQDPLSFARALEGVYEGVLVGSDPLATGGLVRSLPELIRSHATTITSTHCALSTAAGGGFVCEPPQTHAVADLPRLGPDQPLSCDLRPRHHQPVPPSVADTHELGTSVLVGPLTGTAPADQRYGLLFDSLYPPSAPNPFLTATATLAEHAREVVLDHRLGTGGSTVHASKISEMFLPPERLLGGITPLSLASRPSWSADMGKELYQSSDDGFEVGSAVPKAGARLAVLLAHDVSASDFLAFAFSRRTEHPNVRSFGARTDGAFSTLGTMSWAGGSVLFGFGSGDSCDAAGATRVGHGVVPDEEVLQKQSDLLRGVDTVYERARVWLASGKAP